VLLGVAKVVFLFGVDDWLKGAIFNLFLILLLLELVDLFLLLLLELADLLLLFLWVEFLKRLIAVEVLVGD